MPPSARSSARRRSTKAFDSELIVTAWPRRRPSIGRSAGPIDPTDPPAEHAEELEHAKAYLEGEGIQGRVRSGSGARRTRSPSSRKERDADLIVVGTHEPNAIARLFGQSVSDSVAHRSTATC